MNRKYTASEFSSYIENVYQRVPNICIGTDVMVGYPGEDEKAFINTKKFLADLPVAYYHVFTYSDRKGTGSFKLAPKVDGRIKKQRTRVLIEQGRRKRKAFSERFIGKVMPVLFEQRHTDGRWYGHSRNYLTVAVQAPADLHNEIRMVRLISSDDNGALGELVDGGC